MAWKSYYIVPIFNIIDKPNYKIIKAKNFRAINDITIN